jgi:hypothetical protein
MIELQQLHTYTRDLSEYWLFERFSSKPVPLASSSPRRRLTLNELLRRKPEDRTEEHSHKIRLKPWQTVTHDNVEREFVCARVPDCEQAQLVEQLTLMYQEGFVDRNRFKFAPFFTQIVQEYSMHRRRALFQMCNCFKQQLGELERIGVQIASGRQPTAASGAPLLPSTASVIPSASTSPSSLSPAAASPLSSCAALTSVDDYEYTTSYEDDEHSKASNFSSDNNIEDADADRDDDLEPSPFADIPLCIIELKIFLSQLDGLPLHASGDMRKSANTARRGRSGSLTTARRAPRQRKPDRHSWTGMADNRHDCPYSKLLQAVGEFLADDSAPHLEAQSLALLAAQLQLCAKRDASYAAQS